MEIGGFIKNSLIDYPGKIASVVFTKGCNFRCKYCHNPDLVIPERIKKSKQISEDYIFSYLKKNKKMLDAVVVTGGEPLVQKDLIDFIKKIKSLGLLVKLDTNGAFPNILNKLFDLHLIDFIAMDVKAPLEINKYQEITGKYIDYDTIDKIKNSIWLILKSEIPHEFRTTTVKRITNKEDLIKISESIKNCHSFCLQDFNPDVVLDESYKKYTGYSQEVLKLLSESLEIKKDNIVVR